MSGTAHLKSGSGIYHVIVRGSGRQNLFYEKEDFRACQRIILQAKERYEFFLFAYCMMDNHIHLLLKCTFADISIIMQRICSMYAMYLKRTYNREGQLFQGRFRSEPVDDERYFLTVMTYIHGNPCRAGIADEMEEYPYSSYREYVKGAPGMTDKKYILTYLDRQSFIDLHEQERKREKTRGYLAHITEDEARRRLCGKLNNQDPVAFADLNLISQRACVIDLKNNDVTYAQMSRLTGLPYERIRYLGNMKN